MNPMNPKRTRRLRARAAIMNSHEEEFEDYGPEPNMKLSHAFMVVLLLHVVAVVGLYAFNTIKAGKNSSAKVAARSSGSVVPRQEPSNDHGSGNGGASGSGPGEEPPAPAKAPLIAKASDAPKSTKASSETSAHNSETALSAPRGFFAMARSMIGKTMGASGLGVEATASAQESAASAPQAGAATAASAPVATANTYMVKAGDTLTRIASSLGVSIPELKKVNGMTEKSVIQVGQILKVPVKAISQFSSNVSAQAGNVAESMQHAPAAIAGAVSSAANVVSKSVPATIEPAVAEDQGAATEYTVVKGDSPYKIAKKFKITPDELIKANGITDPKKIQIGQKLKIPVSTAAAASKKAAQ